MLLRYLILLIPLALTVVGFTACQQRASVDLTSTPATVPVQTTPPSGSPTLVSAKDPLLEQSWTTYVQRFIQADGRVIDREAGDRTTSEGQAYAMLRAVLIGDRATFDRTLAWAEQNLQRQTNGKPADHLWAWKWGEAGGKWGVLDSNFASDADLDAATALILASRRWQQSEYLQLARLKLNDLWTLSTVTAGPRSLRYLLPGPAAVFQQAQSIQLNPSYFAPAAFRLFAQVDATHDWLSLIAPGYQLLTRSATLSAAGLPSDWVALDQRTGQVTALPNSRYSFDAYRVWWRIALDAAWFGTAEAQTYLQQHLSVLRSQWQSHQRIPAQIDLQGKPLVNYEATSQYGMLYAAFTITDPTIATQIHQQKLVPNYHQGFWDNDSAYYTQNLVWLGLLPPASVSSLLQPTAAAQLTPHL